MSNTILEKKQKNRTFQIVTALAMLMVILGHLDFNILTIGGLFPYYSYHVMTFVFVSGYFYKKDSIDHIGQTVKKKFLHLLIPYFVWNLVYGVLILLLHKLGFSFGMELNVRSLLLEPFLGGHQFALNFPSWFVPALFLIQLVNLLGRKIMSLLHLEWDWLIVLGTLLVGVLVVWLAIGGHVWGYYKTPGRILFMLPCYELGVLYRSKIEPIYHKKVAAKGWKGMLAALLILFLLQFGIRYSCQGLAFSAVWVTSFANLPFVPYLTSITGTAMLILIAELLGKSSAGIRIAQMGDYSFDFMMHHMLGFFVLNCMLCAWLQNTALGFSKESFLTDVNYVWVPAGKTIFKCVYLFCGILLPLAIAKVQRFVIKLLHL